ncbi:MAG: GGDEF domain-containing protein [Lachnospiraceae bacterium]|nr:GGDEF domain-containing protein [Lachnospiraceae bacterium]MDD7177029.1 GGDEF domain-containing protein [bacterium]MDY5517082.1 GGDEF domain-containing protein [Lachnospiraceae bacterium]
MTFVSKVKSFVLQEPQNKNESPKVVVVLRMSCLLFMLYLLSAGVGFVITKHMYLAMFSVLFLILYAYALYCSYQDKMAQAYLLLNINTLLWVIMFYVIFGPNTGVHHFIFALIMVDLLLERRHPVVMIVALYLVRIGLYAGRMTCLPIAVEGMLGKLEIYMYVLSVVLECTTVLFTGIYFTKDAFKMESRLQDYNNELRHVASTDPLTKIWNRFRMLEHVEKCLKKYQRGELQFLSLAIGDIDFFKRVNDTYGHECGDEVLRSLAHLFDEEMRGIGAVARWGGEEFLFLFENMNGDDAWTALSLIQTKLGRLDIPYEGQLHRVTMTFGLTEYDFHLSLDDNIKLADDKLYKGKESGRNRVIY